MDIARCWRITGVGPLAVLIVVFLGLLPVMGERLPSDGPTLCSANSDCTLQLGYFCNGTYCIREKEDCGADYTDCATTPCVRGECWMRYNRSYCACPGGYSGKRCDHRIRSWPEENLYVFIVWSAVSLFMFALLIFLFCKNAKYRHSDVDTDSVEKNISTERSKTLYDNAEYKSPSDCIESESARSHTNTGVAVCPGLAARSLNISDSNGNDTRSRLTAAVAHNNVCRSTGGKPSSFLKGCKTSRSVTFSSGNHSGACTGEKSCLTGIAETGNPASILKKSKNPMCFLFSVSNGEWNVERNSGPTGKPASLIERCRRPTFSAKTAEHDNTAVDVCGRAPYTGKRDSFFRRWINSKPAFVNPESISTITEESINISSMSLPQENYASNKKIPARYESISEQKNTMYTAPAFPPPLMFSDTRPPYSAGVASYVQMGRSVLPSIKE